MDDLLDVSRITRSAVVLNKQLLDVRGVVRAAVDGSMQWLEPRRHTVSVELPPGEPLVVLGDEKRLIQVLQNLLHNAARYTPEGGQVAERTPRER